VCRGAGVPAVSTRHAALGGSGAAVWRFWSGIPIWLAVLGGCTVIHALTLVEGPSWTSPLLLLDWLFNALLAGLILLYSLAIGRRVARLADMPGGDEAWELLAAVGLGAILLSLALLILGFARLYSWPPLAAGWIAVTVWLRGEFVLLYRQVDRAWRRWRYAGFPTAPDLLQRAALAALLATAVPILLRTMLPVTEWDAVIYHLASIKLYLAAHRFIPLPTLALANEPSGAEMLYLPALLVGADGAGKVLNLLFALLLGAAVCSLGTRLFGRFAGWTALILVLSPVWLQLVLPLTLTDLASSSLIVLAVGDACAWAGTLSDGKPALGRGVDPPSQGIRLLLRAGFFAGGAVSFKLTSAAVGPALLGTVALSALTVDSALPRLRRARLWAAVCACMAAGGAVLIAPAPWFLKNLYFFGSVTDRIPIQVSNPSHGITVQQTAPPLSQHLLWVLHAFWSMLWTHLGPLSLFALLALVLCRRPDQRLLGYFFLCGSVIWLLFIPFYEPPRYYIGLLAVAAVLAGGGIQGILDLLPRPSLLRLGVSVLLVVGTIPGLLIGVGIAEDPTLWGVVDGSISRQTYLTDHLPAYAAESWANAHLPARAVPALVNVVSGFYMDRPHLDEWYGQTLAALERSRASRRAVFRTWCRAGVGYAIFDRGSGSLDDLSRTDVRPLASFRWAAAPGLAPSVLFSARGVDVLAVQPCAAARE
jgi:hypothetical protein